MKNAFEKTWQAVKTSLPIMAAVLMLVSLLNPVFEKYYPRIFTGSYIFDPFIGAVMGSFSFGMPIVSYVTGGELLEQGVSLLAVTAFVFSWTTVGIPMLPLEAAHLGKKFAIIRNGLNFIFSVLVAILTVATLEIIQ
ncbi:MAG: hypothetical protein A2288_02150 [Candidatus Moranbacteria bacterium RIFOXYA12_FULL_44_15]|nr:MAG: hypothetical protein A2288_02150 [Candidatus Moranbacteria bacterium RIFOXYA12_FULL_44_15]OGI34523.1 MAG: hypothetical protein A2259_01260 [Candidatus Moranbacteria bacterium RIFOXYA2_FULL_43_15]